jgi:hypothetical protein
LKRERVDFSQPGRFYYPLASRVGYTGTSISINAPFEMDGERQAPIDSPWNRWLVAQAVSLTMDVLRDDLFDPIRRRRVSRPSISGGSETWLVQNGVGSRAQNYYLLAEPRNGNRNNRVSIGK